MEGSLQEIDGMLSALKSVLRYEAIETRLEITFAEARDYQTGEGRGSFYFILRVWERGPDAQISLRNGSPPKGKGGTEALAWVKSQGLIR